MSRKPAKKTVGKSGVGRQLRSNAPDPELVYDIRWSEYNKIEAIEKGDLENEMSMVFSDLISREFEEGSFKHGAVHWRTSGSHLFTKLKFPEFLDSTHFDRYSIIKTTLTEKGEKTGAKLYISKREKQVKFQSKGVKELLKKSPNDSSFNDFDDIDVVYRSLNEAYRSVSDRTYAYVNDCEMTLMDPEFAKSLTFERLGTYLDEIKSQALISGSHTSWLYIGAWGASFICHREDLSMGSINFHYYGAPKIWIIVDPLDTRKYEDWVLRTFGPCHDRDCIDFCRHNNFFFHPHELTKAGIRWNVIVQKAGDLVILGPHVYHCGINLGLNLNQAINFLTKEYLPFALLSLQDMCTEGCSDPGNLVTSNLREIVRVHKPEWYEAYIRDNLLINDPFPKEKSIKGQRKVKARYGPFKDFEDCKKWFLRLSDSNIIAKDERLLLAVRELANFSFNTTQFHQELIDMADRLQYCVEKMGYPEQLILDVIDIFTNILDLSPEMYEKGSEGWNREENEAWVWIRRNDLIQEKAMTVNAVRYAVVRFCTIHRSRIAPAKGPFNGAEIDQLCQELLAMDASWPFYYDIYRRGDVGKLLDMLDSGCRLAVSFATWDILNRLRNPEFGERQKVLKFAMEEPRFVDTILKVSKKWTVTEVVVIGHLNSSLIQLVSVLGLSLSSLRIPTFGQRGLALSESPPQPSTVNAVASLTNDRRRETVIGNFAITLPSSSASTPANSASPKTSLDLASTPINNSPRSPNTTEHNSSVDSIKFVSVFSPTPSPSPQIPVPNLSLSEATSEPSKSVLRAFEKLEKTLRVKAIPRRLFSSDVDERDTTVSGANNELPSKNAINEECVVQRVCKKTTSLSQVSTAMKASSAISVIDRPSKRKAVSIDLPIIAEKNRVQKNDDARPKRAAKRLKTTVDAIAPIQSISKKITSDRNSDALSSLANTQPSTSQPTGKFTCTVCRNGFASKSNLNKHIRGVACSVTNPEFPCQFCSRIFKQQKRLENHVSALHQLK